MTKNHLFVSEIFGPTIQGEGPGAGRLAVFLRLTGCNLDCVWCDTKYSWDKSREDFRSDRMTVEDVAEKLFELQNGTNAILVITGGETMLQAENLNKFIPLVYFFPSIEIETNGTVTPNWLSHYPKLYFNVSPKLSNSQVDFDKRIDYKLLRFFAFTNKAIFKFVIQNTKDLEEVKMIVEESKIPNGFVWIMPQTPTDEYNHECIPMQELVNLIISNNWNISPRLHYTLWGNQKGK